MERDVVTTQIGEQLDRACDSDDPSPCRDLKSASRQAVGSGATPAVL